MHRLRLAIAFCLLTLLGGSSSALAQEITTIREIEVTGNQAINKDLILDIMRTKPGQPYVQSQIDLDRRTLTDLGFFKAVDILVKPVDNNQYDLLVTVSEFGPVREVRVIGNTVVDYEDILRAANIKAGDPFNVKVIAPGRRAIQQLYQEKGFFANVDEFDMPDETPGVVVISIIELQVNSVGWSGNERTKDWVMRRLIKTRPGEAFAFKRWENDIKRLWGTGWFEVNPVMRDAEEIGKVDLIAEVKEIRTGVFNAGVVLDPRSGFAGTIRVAESNFRGTGQSVGLDFLQSTRGGGPSVSLDWANPFWDDKDTAINVQLYSRVIFRFVGDSFGGGSVLDTNEQYNERRTGIAVGLGRPVNDHLTTGYGLRVETIRTQGLSPATAANSVQQDGTIIMGSLSVTMNYRDVDIDPSRGYWTRVQLEPAVSNITKVGGLIADPAVLGTNVFTRLTVDYRYYWTWEPPRGLQLDAPRRVIALRAKAGTIAGNVPFFEQFFVGGSETLRGYREDEFWGRNMFLASAEFRYPIQKAFNAVLFVDYGGAWGGFGSILNLPQSSKPNFKLGYGFGFSFKTPVGPIRLDVGFNQNGKARTHFMIGYTF
ncbi:MAG: outer membrane protein assembly factor [Fimbriimonadaceae bacterium]